ncbi:MAG: hypothetical protein ACYTAN_10325 [Planctomycetota bacterium]
MADLSIYSRAQIDALVASSGVAEWELRSSGFTDTLVGMMMQKLEEGTLAAGPLPKPTGTATPTEQAFSAFVGGVASDITAAASSMKETLAAGATGALEAAQAAGKVLKFLPIIAVGVVLFVVYLKVK